MEIILVIVDVVLAVCVVCSYMQKVKLRACVKAGDELCRELESGDGDRVEIQRSHYLQVRLLSGIRVEVKEGTTLEKPIYYDCGICGHFHPWGWDGDCRDDENRLTYDDLDDRHGENGYEIRTMEERLASDRGVAPEMADEEST